MRPVSGMSVEDNSWYLDIVSARIQTWLSRTPKLRYRRGASTALADATSRAAFDRLRVEESWLTEESVEWNDEAGEVSGVVALTLPGTLGEAAATRLAQRVAAVVAQRIRSQIPACPLSAAVSAGASYLEAYEAKERRVMIGDLLLDLPGGPDESFVSLPCDMCGARSVTHEHVLVFKDVVHDLCHDCYTRQERAGFSSSETLNQLPESQRTLYQRMMDLPGVQELDFPNDFSDLAARGRRAGDDASTQLALIYADGNRIGDLLHGLISAQAKSAQARALVKADIAVAIDEASKASIVDAVRGTFIDGDLVMGPLSAAGLGPDDWAMRPPVVVHVAAGDDIFVSVPAGMGWTFLRVLCSAFTGRVKEGLAKRAEEVVAPQSDWEEALKQFIETPFTLSAGLVFHHASEPFADVVERAEARIGVAKQYTAGRAASVSFLDMTADGADPVGDREWRLDEFPDAESLAAKRLGRIAAVPASHRSQLLTLLRGIVETEAQGPGPADRLTEALPRRVVTLGYEVLWQVVCDDDSTGDELSADRVQQVLVGPDGQIARRRLRRYLDTARWWPPHLSSSDPRPDRDPHALGSTGGPRV